MNTYAADLHTHTIASGHAYSTIKEMAIAAEEKGIRLLGITEHSKGMPGSCQDIYFSNLRVVDRKIGEVELAMGVELNIIVRNIIFYFCRKMLVQGFRIPLTVEKEYSSGFFIVDNLIA